MDLFSNYREITATQRQRQTLIALSGAYLLVQVASFPVVLAIPSIADDFRVSLSSAAWVIIAELLALGSTVFLAAKLGDRFGHNNLFVIGVLVTTVGAVSAGFSQSFVEFIIYRGVQGLGAALVTGNANAILAWAFPADQRGRAYAIPITSARLGTLVGLVVFAAFLQFIGWRAVFFSFLPLGLIALAVSVPLLRQKESTVLERGVPMDYVGGILFIGAIATLILSGVHLHGGEESFTSSDALSYHIPMHLTFLIIVLLFILTEKLVRHPFIDFSHFRRTPFTLALFANIAFHMAMLAIMTLVPIMVENGFEYEPIFVIYSLLPHQTMGLFIPLIAGWYYDKYKPTLLRPIAMCLIALGIFLLGMFSLDLGFWYMPLLLLPATIGTSIFNTMNNSTIMNTIPQEYRGFGSGMMETTRHVGHTLGATVAASVLGLVLPMAVSSFNHAESFSYYARGFQVSALAVVWIVLLGALTAYLGRQAPTLPNSDRLHSA